MPAEVARTDLSFHQTIVDAAGSNRLSRMFSTLVAETLLCMHRFQQIFDPQGEIIDQHQRLADLFRSGDADAYLNEIDWHLRNSVIRLTQAGDANGPRPSSADCPVGGRAGPCFGPWRRNSAVPPL